MEICIHSFHRCHTQFDAYPNYIQIKMFVKQLINVFKERKKTDVRAHVFNAGLLVRSQFSSGRSCDRPTQIKGFYGFP
jgi:hypothetical protein